MKKLDFYIADETVNAETITDDYEHFVNIKNKTFYTLTKNDVKMIAIYEYQLSENK